jgi:hypothetical protein
VITYHAGHLTAVLGDLPDYQTAYKNGLPPLVERLKNELTRKTAILALKSICHSPLTIEMGSVLPEVVGRHSVLYMLHGRHVC